MAGTMSTKKRVKRMYAHQEADRVPVIDQPWGATLERWHKEGMPHDVEYIDYFGLDKFETIFIDNSPQFPQEVIEETEDYVIRTSRWGATLKEWKHRGGVPEFLEYRISDPDSWQDAKERMKPDPGRIDWDDLDQKYKNWRDEGAWISVGFWFGFDVTHARAVGTERLLTSMIDNPEWVKDMFSHFLEMNLKLYQMIWDKGYHFDEVSWPDDLGYKGAQFFSLKTYRELLKPFHKKAADWAHEKGIKVKLHSCGDVNPFVPEFIDLGIDMLNPLEVKAGMNPIELKEKYGDKLCFQGGINALLYEKPEKLWSEMKKIIPQMKKQGGYIVSSDHSVPENFSRKQFEEFVSLAHELGSY